MAAVGLNVFRNYFNLVAGTDIDAPGRSRRPKCPAGLIRPDLVQTKPHAAGPMMDALREVLDPWLGRSRCKQSEGRVTFIYRFDSEDTPPLPLRLKVETNTREHCCAGS